MKKAQIIDLIIADINKFLIKEKIDLVKVELRQTNGVPILCEGDIPANDKVKVNEHLKKYKNKYEIMKLIINFRYGNMVGMEKKIGKKHIAKRYKNYLKNEAELMELIGAETILKLK